VTSAAPERRAARPAAMLALAAAYVLTAQLARVFGMPHAPQPIWIPTGIATFSPSRVVVRSRFEVSTMTRWRNRMASRSVRLARSVTSS